MTSNPTMNAALSFHEALAAPECAPEISASADVYGWLLGGWELDVLFYLVDLSGQGLKGEAHFARTLEGRAVQDVWMMPRRSERSGAPDKTRNMYGTTLRIWDPVLGAWRITWLDPVTGRRDELVGRWDGKDISQVGTQTDGTPIRWLFTEIMPDSFLWTGEVLQPDGKSWTLQGKFRARRISGLTR